MVNYVLTPSPSLRGNLIPPGDKSISHRAVILASLSNGPCQLMGLNYGEDVLCTIDCLQKLGVKIDFHASDHAVVQGVGLEGLTAPLQSLNCGNSGTTMRLLAGVLAGFQSTVQLIGDSSLSRRPMDRITSPLASMGAQITSFEGHAPLTIRGMRPLEPLIYSLPIASAQVKSALLLAGLFAKGVTTLTEPSSTRDHTERMLLQLGYPISCRENILSVEGGHELRACDIQIPGDLSAAAFFIVAATGIPGSEIVLSRVSMNPTRTGFIKILQRMGADITILNPTSLGHEPVADLLVRAHPLQGITIEPTCVASCIDEFPILMIAAAMATGVTRIQGAAELRVKESDRIAVMVEGLRHLGIVVEEYVDGALIQGGKLQGGEVSSEGDHRVAMAFAIAGALSQGSVCVSGCEAVVTSYPDFVHAATSLGMLLEVRV